MVVSEFIKLLGTLPKGMQVVILFNNNTYMPVCKDECAVIEINDEHGKTVDAFNVSPCSMAFEMQPPDADDLNMN